MAAQKRNHPRINLNILHPQGVGDKLPIRFLRWLLSYGRYIVIIVEVVVLLAFVARFKLDADLASLKQSINNEVPFISSKAADEALIRQTQLRINTIKKVYSQSPQIKEVLTKISNQIPASVHLTSISFDHTNPAEKLQFKILAQSSTNSDLAAFLNGLKAEKALSNVTLSSINFDQGQIIFSITGGVK